jgi:hypothetical protein
VIRPPATSFDGRDPPTGRCAEARSNADNELQADGVVSASEEE